ncbi:type-F conjugative transfer system pilin assembly protein TrbC [Vibrio cyclitrophicus]|uniref:Type-F conjugative transfer system pilin assembly protein TrbC n=2 Tax=Vibrio cyclitrophicus TaxID=47951 RepID=A0A7Z1MKY4_9VIBR|nr:type-F conjugative transfer system pilin assembly protein TrbC [Vibrio cyclitrophicus]PMP21137.1 type-F conjugative transfer system pilin assembly protein TrbC [Vibrio cyclitrophicus]PMP30516.1 type-F conjugative transfer system pilin assembly protein TrbC [Vibrio cyclitrophicus]
MARSLKIQWGMMLILSGFPLLVNAEQQAYSQEELHSLQAQEQQVSKPNDFQDYFSQRSPTSSDMSWVKSVQNDAMSKVRERSGEKAPLPNVMVFTSLGLPKLTLKQQLAQSQQYQVPLIVRGLLPEGFEATSKRIMSLLGLTMDGTNSAHKINSGFAVSPEWFKKFQVESVPAVLVIKAGRCQPQGLCAKTDFDIVYGNIAIPDALEMFAQSGDVAEVAEQILIRGQQ